MSKQWPLVKLGEVLTRAERWEERDAVKEYPFAGTYSYARGIFVGEKKHGSTFNLPKVQRLHAGDFVYCKIMAWEGAFGVVPKEAHNCVMSGAFVAYEVDVKRLDLKFLDYFFKVAEHWKKIGSQSTGTNVRRQSLHPNQFENAQIPLPPLAEQRRLVARIEALAGMVAEAQALRKEAVVEAEALVDRHAKSVIDAQETQVGREAFGAHAKIQGGYAFSSTEYQEVGLPLVRINSLQNETVRVSGAPCMASERLHEFSRFVLNAGDVLLALTGPPKLGVVPDDCKNWLLNQRVGRFVVRDQSKSDAMYLYWVARSFKQQINDAGYGGAQANVSSSDIEEMEFPFPDLPTQRRIVHELNALQAKVEGLKRLQAETQAELDALLPAVLEGVFNPNQAKAYQALDVELGLAAEP